MADNELTTREQQILEAIVRNYVVSAAPTGSRFLSKNSEVGLSPASIRNVMGDLEEKGYICQPHTSAGRIPTDKGYRLYVDTLMQNAVLPEEQKEKITQIIESANHSDLHVLMDATSKALSMVTDQLGLILSPRLSHGVFRHLHIFEIEPHRFMLQLTIDSGFVRTMTVELQSDIPAVNLEQACNSINQRFYGMRLHEINEHEGTIFTDVELASLGVIRLFVPSLKKMMQADESGEIFTEGTTNIVLKPEFGNREQMGAVIEILGEKKMLMHLLNIENDIGDKVVISIGGENKNGVFESFSILKAKYKIGTLEGTLGVMGPKRMPYPFVISAVDYTAKLLGSIRS